MFREARLLERRLFASLFEHAPIGGVLDALRGYQNEDGGFGHGLEPDKLCPASQPIDVAIALQAMDAIGAIDEQMVRASCEFLAAVSRDGSLPLAFRSIERSRWRPLFTDDVIDGHLDRLETDQQPDGGWPLTWEPPSRAATLAWRGMETLRALRVLIAYGRLPAPVRTEAAR